MKYIDALLLKKPKQERSIKAIEDILDSAKLLSDEGMIELLNVRGVSTKSGYSVATIYRHFEKFDDVFLALFLWRRKKINRLLLEAIQSHDPNSPLKELVTHFVNIGIAGWSSKNPKIVKMVIRLFFKHSKEPEKFNTLIDELFPYFLDVQRRDLTGTFRPMSEDELRLQFRAIQVTIRNPFFEGDPIAGTEEHRRWVIDMGTRLLGKAKD